ncbi:MAG TPA: protocatechuate 3,4-dioxygenase subunit alpha [Thermoleophilaceae bacterium]|nr:protocatechuate 3,4-dioxygenase subunit alpha [Thermoleophilaceae bacterium]
MTLRPTASQTVGPYFHIGLPWDDGPDLVPANHHGVITLEGTLSDGDGAPVNDGLIEIWQANQAGRYAHPEDERDDVPLEDGFKGFGRSQTDDRGRYRFRTVKPGAVPAADGRMQAPHIELGVFARGLLQRVVTRVYFPDEQEANAADPLLSSIEDEAVRGTLLAEQQNGTLRFDIRLQGDGETAFLDV